MKIMMIIMMNPAKYTYLFYGNPQQPPPLLGQLTVVLGIIHVKYIITLKINRHEMIRSKRLSDYDTSVVVIVIEAKGPRCVFLFGGKASECKR
jgi:hypothetical protein